MDTHNDPIELSSRKVKRAMWVSDNVPEHIRGTEGSLNGLLCSLRDALNPSNPNFGKRAGINFKVNVCMNADGPPILLKSCTGVVADSCKGL